MARRNPRSREIWGRRRPGSGGPRKRKPPEDRSSRNLRPPPYFQAPKGYWTRSVRHRLAWALSQVLVVQKGRETGGVRLVWQERLRGLIHGPVAEARWEDLARRLIQKAEDEQPQDAVDQVLLPFVAAILFLGIMDLIRDLHRQAGQLRWAALVQIVPFPQEAFEDSLRAYKEQLVGITDTLQRRLGSIAVEALKGSTSAADFAQRLKRAWLEFAQEHAILIVDHEWAVATGEAALLAYDLLGVKTKSWVTAGDGDVCVVCEANAAEGPIPIDEDFPSGHHMHPAHPHCRCEVQTSEG